MSSRSTNNEKKWRKLYELRMKQKLTQKQVAEFLGIDNSNISAWELHGARWFEWIKNLCKVLKCSPNELFDYEEPSVVKHFAEEDPIDPETLELAKLLNDNDLSSVVDALDAYEADLRERIGKGFIDLKLVNTINRIYDLRMIFKKHMSDDRLVRA